MGLEWLSPEVLIALGAILVLVGMAGTVLPALPGIPLVYAGLLLVAWAGQFQQVSIGMMVLLAVLAALSMLIDFLAGLMGTKGVGASKYAVIGAALGTLVGIFFGLLGLLLGPFIGAVLGEWIATRDLPQSARAGAGAWLGFIFGALTKIVLSFFMLGLFLLAYFF